MKKGFTLIELLVVVLIIGILAAVAVPQYRLAVDRAKLSKLVAVTQSVVQAEEAYYLANGEYSTDWDSLAVNFAGQTSGSVFTSSEGWTLTLSTTNTCVGCANAVTARFSQPNWQDIQLLAFYNDNRMPAWRGNIGCYAKKENAWANALCKHLRGAPHNDNTNMANVYWLKR